MKNIKKFTPCRYIVICTIIAIIYVLSFIYGIYSSDTFIICIAILGVVLFSALAFAVSKYNVVVDDLYFSCNSIFKKTSVLRPEITHAKYVLETYTKGSSPVFCVYTLNSSKPSIKIRIRFFSHKDVREIAKILSISNF